jgi:uracil-DNA glycosylase
VRRLNEYVAAANHISCKSMPYFDPLDGGIEARVLILLESPTRSGPYPRFASRDNRSPTQVNLNQCLEQSGLTRKESVLWNAYPWLPDKFGAHRTLPIASITKGMLALTSVLKMLPNIEVAVLAGSLARKASSMICRYISCIEIIETFNPSPKSLSVDRSRRDHIIDALKSAKLLLDAADERSRLDY